ncbi:MAG: ATP-binding cassette domain-containing protein [Chloroflexi bacterium]|jgi:tungstate transport system ATP-binding protein|nr:ATP-binding cassette domain-containing protein [Chloroflexota bacterium]
MSDFIYRLQNVSKTYDERRVLTVDHLKIRRGEIFGLVGPSGAGKSTLLRLLNFLEPPTTGRIRFLDVEFSADQEVPLRLRRRVTTVFQRPVLLNRSVQSNVNYGLKIRGQSTQDEVEATLKEVGLRHLAHQRAKTLSGGEAQRVALARAIVLRPDVLLLDEPTANLDPYNVGLIEEIIQRRNQEQGTTLILVTHNVFQAKRLAQRVALILDGSIVEVANVEKFFEAPDDPRTAAFVRGEIVY